MNPYSALVSAYLDGENGSANVLDDFLEDKGEDRVAEVTDLPGRLKIVLDRLLPAREADDLACDFAEHVHSVLERNGIETKAVKDALAAKRQSGENVSSQELSVLADNALSDWQPDNSTVSRAIWSTWAAVLANPSCAAGSAQAARDGELEWQVERTKEVLEKLTLS